MKLLKSSSAYAIIKINDNQPETYVNGGQMMERFWITANKLGLSVQPMAGFVFLLNHLLTDDARQFNNSHRAMIKNFKSKLNTITGINNDLTFIMFFRLGYCEEGTKRTERLNSNFTYD